MGTLGQVKMRMKQDRDMRKRLVRGGRHEILLDLDGDKFADLGLMDENMDGDIDTMALDLGGSGDFDLYMTDMDGNNVIDRAFFDEEGNGSFAAPAWGDEILAPMLEAATRLYRFLASADWDTAQLDAYLEELSGSIAPAAELIGADFEE